MAAVVMSHCNTHILLS